MLKKYQAGVGLLEVLVALLILAVAVLGFSAMQMRAIQATDETLTRSDAMVIIRNISEDLRLYPSLAQKTAYIAAINAKTKVGASDGCDQKVCTQEQQLQYSVSKAVTLAELSNISLGADFCPGVATDLKKVCLIASWNGTKADTKGGSDSCANSAGVYQKGANCIMMETY